MVPWGLQVQPWSSNSKTRNRDSSSSNKYKKVFSQLLTVLLVSRPSSRLVGVRAQGRPCQAMAVVGAGAAALPSSITPRAICPGTQIWQDSCRTLQLVPLSHTLA